MNKYNPAQFMSMLLIIVTILAIISIRTAYLYTNYSLPVLITTFPVLFLVVYYLNKEKDSRIPKTRYKQGVTD